ncbi:unnamed protein product [Meganyctiphanes norvegica]|uniref:Ileal sodium/bile acid cotransporter n=1 Tax=Meganyctiphanes norvegica TaxID=48144 RepID=A0AAV2QBF5_MEGNR
MAMFNISRGAELVLGLLFMTLVVGAYAQDTSKAQLEDINEDIWFNPSEVLLLPEGSVVNISWFTTLQDITRVTYHVEDEFVSTVLSTVGQYELIIGSSDYNFYNVSSNYPNSSSSSSIHSNYTYMGTFEAQANFIGFNKIFVTLYDDSNQVVGVGQFKMTVSLSYQNLNDIFTIALGFIIAFMYVTMGATLDIDVIWQIFKAPIGPVIGLVCQYLFMPLIAYAIGLALFPDDPLLRLGLFLSGCSPGGGASNMWTHLLGGSLDLSIMMTFVSTIVAFGTVPLWVFSMGPLILQGADFVVPYKDIAVMVVSLVIPCGIGFAIQKFLPRAAKVLEWLLTPFSIFNLLFTFTFGVYSNRYIFSILDWKIFLAGFGLPFIGYCSGCLAAVLFKRKAADAVAIAIETGIQNNTVALFILKFTLERPAGDLTVVVPAASFMMTPVPLLVAVFVKKGYEWQVKRQQQDITTKESNIKEKPLSNVPHNDKTQSMANGVTGVDNPAADLRDEVV